jgi:hypothetical protein
MSVVDPRVRLTCDVQERGARFSTYCGASAAVELSTLVECESEPSEPHAVTFAICPRHLAAMQAGQHQEVA